ncbi:MAG: hypothetical protein NVS1B7_0240 [Candidatus Saccharimonadales bacterium]
MKITKSEQGFAHILIVLLVLVLVGGVGFYVFNKSQNNSNPLTSNTKKSKPRAHPGVITSEVFAASIDANNAPVSPVTTFAENTPKIYTSLGLNGAKASQRLEYTRYLNGKFVDKGSIPLTKDGARYASIIFDLKPGKTHPKGTYLIKTYTNGIFEKSASYQVQ